VLQGKLGELLVSLCYQPTAECITVIVARARELKAKDINGLSGASRVRAGAALNCMALPLLHIGPAFTKQAHARPRTRKREMSSLFWL